MTPCVFRRSFGWLAGCFSSDRRRHSHRRRNPTIAATIATTAIAALFVTRLVAIFALIISPLRFRLGLLNDDRRRRGSAFSRCNVFRRTARRRRCCIGGGRRRRWIGARVRCCLLLLTATKAWLPADCRRVVPHSRARWLRPAARLAHPGRWPAPRLRLVVLPRRVQAKPESDVTVPDPGLARAQRQCRRSAAQQQEST